MITFMGKYKIKILTKDYYNVTSQRRNDTRIMKECVQSHLTEGELIQVNICRLFLQVSNLSDIATANGKEIIQVFLSESKPQCPYSSYRWSHQPTSKKQA